MAEPDYTKVLGMSNVIKHPKTPVDNTSDRSQSKFLLGWINRTLKELT